jgi:SAM-dependent methyltransferase
MVLKLVNYLLGGAVKASMLGLRRGPHVTRYFMYKRLAGLFSDAGARAQVLSISHSVPLCQVLGLGAARIVEANYPETNILALPHDDETFDYVVSDQVLEHIEGDPFVAVGETFRILKPGGIAVHTTCFMNPIHGAPGDFWRFTPDALRLLCVGFANVTEIGGWGNPGVFAAMAIGLRYEGVPEAVWHPYHWIAVANLARVPVSTWVVARKR